MGWTEQPEWPNNQWLNRDRRQSGQPPQAETWQEADGIHQNRRRMTEEGEEAEFNTKKMEERSTRENKTRNDTELKRREGRGRRERCRQHQARSRRKKKT